MKIPDIFPLDVALIILALFVVGLIASAVNVDIRLDNQDRIISLHQEQLDIQMTEIELNLFRIDNLITHVNFLQEILSEHCDIKIIIEDPVPVLRAGNYKIKPVDESKRDKTLLGE